MNLIHYALSLFGAICALLLLGWVAGWAYDKATGRRHDGYDSDGIWRGEDK